VGGTSMKYTINRPTLPSSWHVQVGIDFAQIEAMALEEVSFLLREKLRCPLVNQVKKDISTPMNQPSTCAPQNLFNHGPSTNVYKPLDPDTWPKSRNGKKIRCPDMFKLSIL